MKKGPDVRGTQVLFPENVVPDKWDICQLVYYRTGYVFIICKNGRHFVTKIFIFSIKFFKKRTQKWTNQK